MRETQRRRASALLTSIAASPHLRRLLPETHDVDSAEIQPLLKYCESHDEIALFEYCRLAQRVPSGHRIGRQIRALVYDNGQRRRPLLVGAIGLASPTYALACRDRFLHWSGGAARDTKQIGLRRIMDLALCTVLPPYAQFLGGKLLAALAVVDVVGDEFRRKYKDELLAVTTSCATGIHCPIFNRIGLRRGGLYRRIGTTSGYTLAWMTPRTLQLARRVGDGQSGQTPHSILAFGAKPLVVVRRALKEVGIPFESVLRLGHEKGIYLAPTSSESIELLMSGEPECGPLSMLRVPEVVAHWRQVMLARRCDESRERSPNAEVSQ